MIEYILIVLNYLVTLLIILRFLYLRCKGELIDNINVYQFSYYLERHNILFEAIKVTSLTISIITIIVLISKVLI